MITKRTGHGQTICKGCKEKGKFGLNWDSFLYNFNDEPYCFECLMEMLEIYQDRINKAIDLSDKIYDFIKCKNSNLFYEIEDLLIEQNEILRGEQ